MSMIMKVTKRHWYDVGGFARTGCFRKANRRGHWSYYIDMTFGSNWE